MVDDFVSKAALKDSLGKLSGDELKEAIDALSKLGISVTGQGVDPRTTAETRKLARKMLPPEYDVVATTTCLTCGTVTEQYFRMTQDEVHWALISVPLVEKPKPPFKEISSRNERCKCCQTVLGDLSKEELIQKIFGTIERLKKI